MERLKIDPEQPEPDILEHAARILRRGGVAVYPTETFYGLGANIFDESACQRILNLKGHRGDKPLPVIVAGIEQLDTVVESRPPWLEPIADRFWPGPLSLVLPVRRGLEGPLCRYSSVAARVSSHMVARGLARATEFPLTSTSANPSDHRPARTADEVARHFGSHVDLILDGGRTPGGRPSTIVDLNGPRPRLVRPGPVALESVLEAVREATKSQSLDGQSTKQLE